MPYLLWDNNVQIYMPHQIHLAHQTLKRQAGHFPESVHAMQTVWSLQHADNTTCCKCMLSGKGLLHLQQACHTSSCHCQPCPAKPCAWQCWCPQRDQSESTPVPSSHPPSDASATPPDTLDMSEVCRFGQAVAQHCYGAKCQGESAL